MRFENMIINYHCIQNATRISFGAPEVAACFALFPLRVAARQVHVYQGDGSAMEKETVRMAVMR